MPLRTLARVARRAAPRAGRGFSTAEPTSVVDQMIAYARQVNATSPSQSQDVLRSGLSMTTAASLDHARLHVASADLYHQALAYVSALDSASAALEIASAAGGLSDPEEAEVTSADLEPDEVSAAVASVAHAAASVGAAAALAHGGAAAAPFASTPGGDAWLRDLVHQAEGGGPLEGALEPRGGDQASGPLEALWASQRQLLVAVRAAAEKESGANEGGEGASAAASSASTASPEDAPDGGEPASPGLSASVSSVLPSVIESALEVASTLASLEKQGGASSSSSSLPALVPPTPYPTPLVAPGPLARDARVSALLLAGESMLALRDLDLAEATLSEAVTEAEAGPEALLAAPLLALGHLYARSSRVTLAEGLYREAAKRMGLKGAESGRVRWTAAPGGGAPATHPAGATGGIAPSAPVHPLYAALVAWRNAQLMAALPRRAKETEAWKEVAAELFARGTPNLGRGADDALARIESRWGALKTLRGEGTWGGPAIVDVRTRRVFI